MISGPGELWVRFLNSWWLTRTTVIHFHRSQVWISFGFLWSRMCKSKKQIHAWNMSRKEVKKNNNNNNRYSFSIIDIYHESNRKSFKFTMVSNSIICQIIIIVRQTLGGRFLICLRFLLHVAHHVTMKPASTHPFQLSKSTSTRHRTFH